MRAASLAHESAEVRRDYWAKASADHALVIAELLGQHPVCLSDLDAIRLKLRGLDTCLRELSAVCTRLERGAGGIL